MTDSDGSALENSRVMLVRPEIRIALKRGTAHGQFAELVKQAVVKIAERRRIRMAGAKRVVEIMLEEIHRSL